MEDAEAAERDARAAKRRRVAQACANCRRRKTRCDGHCPCTGCSVLNLECTFDPTKYSSSATYIASLETELVRLQRQQGSDAANTLPALPQSSAEPEPSRGPNGEPPYDSEDDDLGLTTIVSHDHSLPAPGSRRQSVKEEDLGGFGGLNILRRLHKLCDSVTSMSPEKSNAALTSALNVRPPVYHAPIPWDAMAMLPSRQTILQAIDVVHHDTCCTLQLFDPNQVRDNAEAALKAVECGKVSKRRKSVGLLFAILALAHRFDESYTDDDSDDQSVSFDDIPDRVQVSPYFRASRTLIDPSNCQDLVTLQNIVLLVLYTQSCNMLSMSYSYICMAVAAALQMNLFEQWHHRDESDEESARLKAVASVLFILDTYVTTLLGLPRTLRDIDLDSVAPQAALHDGPQGLDFETRAHAGLARILARIVDSHHPAGKSIPHSNGVYTIAYAKIIETENTLGVWFEQLNKSVDTRRIENDPAYLRSQLMLRLYHAHVQMVLYRPFLHHTLQTPSRDDRLNMKAYACGSACVKASMQVVWLVEKMHNSNVLNVAQWFFSQIIANTAACLVLFVSGARNSAADEETLLAIDRLKQICLKYADRSDPMRKCLAFLEGYFPTGEPLDQAHSDELKDRFESNMSQFANAAESESPGDEEGDGMRALNMPLLNSFLHTSL